MPDMSLFRFKNTKLEVFLRKLIFARGYRYRLHVRELKGTPDLVFPKYRAVIFIHGCFWHCHTRCAIAHLPKSNRRFWVAKFRRNRQRDHLNEQWMAEHGWRVLTIWECALRKPVCFTLEELLDFIGCWLEGGAGSCHIEGAKPLPLLRLEFDLCKARNLRKL